MPKFFIKWQLDSTKIPANPEERVKGWLSMLEMTRANMTAGVTKDWGCFAGGNGGYSIGEAPSETELFTNLLRWMPHVQFEVTPVLTVDQTIEAIKKAAAAAQAK